LGNVSPVAVQINGGLNLKGEQSLRRSRAIPLAAALPSLVSARWPGYGKDTARSVSGRNGNQMAGRTGWPSREWPDADVICSPSGQGTRLWSCDFGETTALLTICRARWWEISCQLVRGSPSI